MVRNQEIYKYDRHSAAVKKRIVPLVLVFCITELEFYRIDFASWPKAEAGESNALKTKLGQGIC